MKFVCSALLVLQLVTSAMANGIDIIGFDGQRGLQFQGSSVSNYYTLEFAPSPDGPWTNWGSVSSQPITGSVMSLPTPFFYRIKQIDPDQTSSYATGTPVYAESDPFWNAQKSSYATGTPLYSYTETDPAWNAEKSSYATGTPVYAETDPLWSAAQSNYTTFSNVLALLGQYGLVPAIHVSGNLAFGSITTGQTATATMTISNASVVAALTVTGITYPTGFSGTWSGKLAPGAATNITVTFAPTQGQDYSGSITVNADAISGNPVIPVTGYGFREPVNMSLIPAGAFVMGDTFNDGLSDELPLHTNYISAFYIDQYEVTLAMWTEVYTWAITNGYAFGSPFTGKDTNHPVVRVNWYDTIAWCNARSQWEGLTPCYTNANGTIYKLATVLSFDGGCNWAANGYRLPTEAEWEKAARGGIAGQRFPWGDTISHSNANYYAWPNQEFSDIYDVSLTAGNHPLFITESSPFTSPVGYFAPNGYGLYDMAGNVAEWCWDFYDSTYYSDSPLTDPRGASTNESERRVTRGGSWDYESYHARVARRSSRGLISEGNSHIGFRCVRGL